MSDEPISLASSAQARSHLLLQIRKGFTHLDAFLERVRGLIVWLYARMGSRIVLVAQGAAVAFMLITTAIGGVILARLLGLSAAQLLSWALIWTPIAVMLVVIGILRSRQQIQTILAWSPVRSPPNQAADVWSAIVRLPSISIRAASYGSVAVAGGLIDLVVRFHEPAWGVLPLAAGALNFVTAAWVAVVFTQMLIIQPMLEDVVAHLPAGFEPEVRGVSFRRRAVAPLMVVFCFGMGLTAAFANLVGDGIWRFTLVACVSLPVVAIAYLMFLMISRSVLDPVSAVIDAADRVRRGDLATPVPVLSADELGTLAHRFNEMLNGLRERERLREDLLGRTEELRASRQRIVNAADAERRRMERDLHDGAQQRLVLLRLKLSMLERFMDTDADKAKAMRRELTEEIDCALVELRDLAHGIYPTALETEGLPAALRDALPRSALPVDLDAGEIGRYPAEIEAAVYFCCLEALQNAAKHAGQHARAAIHLEQQNGVLRFEVTDDGAGFDPGRASASAGIQNMADRIGALGGELHVDSTPGHGTKIAGTIPLET